MSARNSSCMLDRIKAHWAAVKSLGQKLWKVVIRCHRTCFFEQQEAFNTLDEKSCSA